MNTCLAWPILRKTEESESYYTNTLFSNDIKDSYIFNPWKLYTIEINDLSGMMWRDDMEETARNPFLENIKYIRWKICC